jgi:hypothetical protein
LLNFHDQELALDHTDGIWEQRVLEEAEEPEPEPRERTMTVWKLAEGLGLTEAGIRVPEDNDWNEQRAATDGQGTVRRF